MKRQKESQGQGSSSCGTQEFSSLNDCVPQLDSKQSYWLSFGLFSLQSQINSP